MIFNKGENDIVVSVERMRRSDAYTIENFTDGITLMYRAAKGIYDSYDWKSEPIHIFAGSGNNAGDGYALASILARNGICSTIIRLSDKFSDDGLYYYNMAKELGVEDIKYDDSIHIPDCGTVVDCIFGTGFKGVPEGVAASAINKINTCGAYVISADINSGLNGDTGEYVIAVRSDLTVSIGFLKKGMFKGDASELIGKLVNVDIGIVLVR